MRPAVVAAAALTPLVLFAAAPTAQAVTTQPPQVLASERVVGGQDANISDAPYQIGLSLSFNDGKTYICGGSLISPQWVITAAHCVSNKTTGAALSSARAYAGSATRNAGEMRTVVEIHSKWGPGGRNPAYTEDIALMRLSAPYVLVNSQKETIDLPTPSNSPENWPTAGASGQITGWGTPTTGGPVSTTLQKANVSVLTSPPDSNCGNWGSVYVPGVMLCAQGSENGIQIDTCNGDSGGPLAITGPSGRRILAGITSFGSSLGCAVEEYPGIYTRVSALVNWVVPEASNPPTVTTAEEGIRVTSTATVNEMPAPITGWVVERAPMGSTAYVVAETGTGTSIDFVDTEVSPGLEYTYRVLYENEIVEQNPRQGQYSQAVAGTAPLSAPLIPALGPVTSTEDGFTAQIENFDPMWSWSADATTGDATVSSSGLLTVSGMLAGEQSTVAIKTIRFGYQEGEFVVSGFALESSTSTPTPSGDPTPTPSGDPTPTPSGDPTPTPSGDPTSSPSSEPTPAPSGEPTSSPSPTIPDGAEGTGAPLSPEEPNQPPAPSPGNLPTGSPVAPSTPSVEPRPTPVTPPNASSAGGGSSKSSATSPTSGGSTHDINEVRPAMGSTSGGYTISLVGFGFSTAREVRIGGVAAPFRVVNDAHIEVTVPAGQNPGSADVLVLLAPEVGSILAPGGFVYEAAPALPPVNDATSTSALASAPSDGDAAITGGIVSSPIFNNKGLLTKVRIDFPEATTNGIARIQICGDKGCLVKRAAIRKDRTEMRATVKITKREAIKISGLAGKPITVKILDD